MSSLQSFRWLWLYFVFIRFNISYVRTEWLSPNSSNIQLLGLFADMINTSKPTTSSVHSRAMFKAAVVLSQKYNIKIDGKSIDWQSIQTGGDVMNALSNTCLLMSASNIVGIVGPSLSRESLFIAPFAAKIGIPVISYAATNSDLSDRNAYPAFYRTIPSDNATALAIVKLFSRFNWTSCVIIYQNDIYGSGGAKAISDTFSQYKLTVTQMIIFDIATRNIRGDLRSLLISNPTRIVLLWAESTYTTLILQTALDCDVLGPQFVWILSSDIPLNSFHQTSYQNLIGMLTIEPVAGNVANAPINTTLLNAAYDIWKEYELESFPEFDKVDSYALFTFDATWTLIQSLKQLCSINSSLCVSFINNSSCFHRRFLNSRAFFDLIDSNTFLGVSGFIQFDPNITDRINGTYYIVKNVQWHSNDLNYVPVLIWSDSSGDWISHSQKNVLIWPGNSLILPSHYASLKGVTLRIAVIASAPFTMMKEITDKSGKSTTNIVGYMPELIKLLEDKMKFISNIIIVPSNQTYNSLIDAVESGVYDVVIADATITAARRKKVAFSNSIFDNSLRIIMQETANENVDFLSYLRPFSLKLWLTLLLATIYAGFLIFLLERQENEALKDKSILSSIEKSMWYSTGTIIGYGVDFHVKTAAGRLLTIGLYIFSFISVAAYTAKLASDLTISKSKGIISGIDDIKNGRLKFPRIGIIINSSVEDYYLREVSEGNRNFYQLKSQDDMYDKLLNNIIDAAIMDSGVVEYSTSNIYCNLTLVGTDFDKSAIGIVSQKNWLYQQDLDVNILSLRETGALEVLKRRWFQTNLCSRSSVISNEMTIESMAGLFLTFGVISILALLLFLWTKRFIIKDYLLTLYKHPWRLIICR